MYSSEKKQVFSSQLLAWYHIHKRDLPWRRSRDPYHIWVSEIMLQQTRVETVIPYFNRFIEKFPTIEALATAKEDEVLKMWEGLGYYSRVRNLQTAVKEVHEKYGGSVPCNKSHISTLKGVGPYTTGAILSIAYNLAEPAVDGNVMRVLARYFLIEDDIMKPSTRIAMEHLAKSLIVEGQASDFNQALMEFGATLCTPKSPTCLVCPFLNDCSARQAGMETSLPIKSKGKAARDERRLVAWIEGTNEHTGKILFRQRPQQGLLAKMWELPHIEYESDSWLRDQAHQHTLEQALLQVEGIEIEASEWLLDTEHVFSHIHWQLKVYRAHLKSDLLPYHYRWVGNDERALLTLPTVFSKMFANQINPTYAE
jgi:A/G-specific adenine glycosylase